MHIGYMQPCYRASLEVKNSRAVQDRQESWVRSLGWEDSPEEGMATHSSTLGVAKSQRQMSSSSNLVIAIKILIPRRDKISSVLRSEKNVLFHNQCTTYYIYMRRRERERLN